MTEQQSPIDRLLSAITFDREQLTEEEADDLGVLIHDAIRHAYCPGDFTASVRDGSVRDGSVRDGSAYDGDCGAPLDDPKRKATPGRIFKFDISRECIDCWEGKGENNA